MSEKPTLGFILTKMYMQGKIDLKALPFREQKVLKHIMECHTEVYGYSKAVCPSCGYTAVHYGSCNDSNCPQCGAGKRKEWEEKQVRKLVKAPYYHVIMTVPDQALNPLFLHDPVFMYNALLKATAETLKAFAADSKFLGIETCGFFSLLHTWGAQLNFHCHVHTIFCAGGLDSEGRFVKGKADYLFPAKAVDIAFRNCFLNIVKGRYENDPQWILCLEKAARARWNVEIRPCGTNPAYAIKYLARYANRPAISNGRLISYENGKVTFFYKDYKDNNKVKVMALEDTEFLRRFLMHITPERFIRSRFYGFMGNNASKKLQLVQKLSGIEDVDAYIDSQCDWKREAELEEEEAELDFHGLPTICPNKDCKSHLEISTVPRELDRFKRARLFERYLARLLEHNSEWGQNENPQIGTREKPSTFLQTGKFRNVSETCCS